MTERLPQQKDLARLYDGASIAVIKDRRVLLVRRARHPYARLWSLPGGKTEANETAQDAVRRELKEETGIEAEIERRGGHFQDRARRRRRQHNLPADSVLRPADRWPPRGRRRRRGCRVGASRQRRGASHDARHG